MKALNDTKTAAEMDAIARKFIAKFGFERIDVDTFDMFIIDQGMAHDPRTSDTSDPAHKGFVQERGVAKGRLNAAGGRLFEDELFQIKVTEDRQYAIETFSQNHSDFVADTGIALRKKIDGRMAINMKRENKVITLYKKYPNDPALQTAIRAIALNRQAMQNYTAVMLGETKKIDKVMVAYETLLLELDKK